MRTISNYVVQEHASDRCLIHIGYRHLKPGGDTPLSTRLPIYNIDGWDVCSFWKLMFLLTTLVP